MPRLQDAKVLTASLAAGCLCDQQPQKHVTNAITRKAEGKTRTNRQASRQTLLYVTAIVSGAQRMRLAHCAVLA